MKNITPLRYLAHNGYGTGTNFTLSSVAHLLKDYHTQKNKEIVKEIEEMKEITDYDNLWSAEDTQNACEKVNDKCKSILDKLK